MNLIGNKAYSTFLFFTIFVLMGLSAFSQASIRGKVIDRDSKEPLIGATVFIIGTYKGTYTDDDGKFLISEIKKGDYSIRFSYLGYADKVYNGIAIKEGINNVLDVEMASNDVTINTVEIIGEPNIIDLEDGRSGAKISKEDIGEMNVDNVQDIVSMQAGVNQTPDGIQVRGGRVYETQYLVDGISAKDPLAGTGFGVDVGSNAIDEVEVITGGGGAEYGNGTSGVINTKIREGGKKYSFAGNYYRDNLGFNKNQGPSWNTDQASIALGGPVPFTKGKLKFFLSGAAKFTDDYFHIYADQLHSSLFSKNDSVWAPRQNNKWSHTFKLTYNVKPGLKFSVSNQHSLNINQNTRSLQIIGNDAIMTPGLQYPYSLDMDNATTYTHHSNLTILNFLHLFKERWTINASVGRLFTNLRADANGRPFREETLDQIYDPYSIVSNPVSVFNPNDEAVYVFPGPGLINNGGISTLWHDHYAEEYTLRYKFTMASKNKVHYLSFGQTHKEQEYQWVDVTRPWVGAPIQISDSVSTPSTSIGSSSDVWKSNPASGGFFFQDEIRYKGIIGNVGVRLEYWAPGKFVDDAVNNPDAPVTDATREDYKKKTVPILGRRFKARILPKLNVSFPITPNNVLYFNYGHNTLLPHPRFVYAGLDPVYQDRSFLSRLGNPNLNPEVTVSYEVGLKSQITRDLALTLAAFYNDKFDYIVSRRVIIKDQTGRFVEKTFYINQDYARIRGLELGVTKRFGKWMKMILNGGYQIASGKSNSAAESELQIKEQGFISTSKERFLAWDRPFDFRATFIFTPDSTIKIGKFSFEGWRVFLSSTIKSGLRYTPYELTDTLPSGRPFYEPIQDEPYSKIASPWFWTDLKISKDFTIKQKAKISLSVDFKNIFNNKNSQIINGVTGRAYKEGDPLPGTYRDPMYPDPQDRGIPPFNPARFRQPRHMLLGLKFSF